MNSEDGHIEPLISPYLDKELTANERKRVEAHVAVCERCRKTLTGQQQVANQIRHYGSKKQEHLSTEQLLAYHDGRLDSPWKKEVVESHLASCSVCRQLLGAAAHLAEAAPQSSVKPEAVRAPSTGWMFRILDLFVSKKFIPVGAAVVAVVLFLLFRSTPHPYADLVQITPAAYLPSEVRGEETEETALGLFRKGMQRYVQRDFAGAAPLLRQAAGLAPDNPQLQFFCGVTLLLTEEYKEGLGYLTKAPVLQSVYWQEAQWYAALALLKSGRARQAREFLTELTKSSQDFSERAGKLLLQMDSAKK